MFIVETMLRVVINDEIKQLELPHNLVDKIWNKKRSPFYEGGIEKLVPFNYPALLSRYTESVIFTVPRGEGGLPIRSPALTKLKIGNFDTVSDLKRSSHNWKLMNSYSVTREYLEFLRHLAPQSDVFSSGVAPSEFVWPLENKTGVLPTQSHASFAFKSMFDYFRPKSICSSGYYNHLNEICLNNIHSLMFCETEGIQLFAGIGKSVPNLKLLDLSQTLMFSSELLLYLFFQDAFQSLHEFMYLHKYRVLSEDDRRDHMTRRGFVRTVEPDKESDVPCFRHTFDRYCPWCYDEGAYEDNLRTGLAQEHVNINIVDDRVYRHVLDSEFDERVRCACLLGTVRASDLVRSLTSPAKILLRNSRHLPYEDQFQAEAGTEHLGEAECDASMARSWTWYPPATIQYENLDEEGFGLQKLNPLASSLQVLRVPPFSRSLWGEMIPFLLRCCPKLKTLGKASGTMLGLELHESFAAEDESVETGLEEVFLHLDMLRDEDYAETPNVARIAEGGVVSQNAPNLRFILQNFGPGVFERVHEEDSEQLFCLKEFSLEVWDRASSLLHARSVEERVRQYLARIGRTCPRVRSLHILSLSYIDNSNIANNLSLWEPLLSFKCFNELTLQMNHLIQFTGLIKCVGRILRKVVVAELLGDRNQPSFSSEYEGLDLDEQGALFICENCPYVEEMDLSSVNFVRKFFFGRQMITVKGHFEHLRKFSAGKIDWNSFFQLWKLLVNIKELELAVIVPMFTLNQQLFEDAKVLTIFEIQDLFRANKKIRNTLQKLQINSFKFATFEAAMYFLREFRSLQTVGTIDMENFNTEDREKMRDLADKLDRDKNVSVALADVFEGFY